MIAIWVIVCIAFSSCSGQWIFDPSVPIVNLPFRVTTSVQVSSMFVSSNGGCSDVVTGGSTTLISGGSAVFQVVSQNLTTFHFCDSQTYVSLKSVRFEKLTIWPQFSIRGSLTHITFPTFTPNGSMTLREYSDCSGGIGGQQTLSSSKTIDVTFSTSGFYFVCLAFWSSVVSRQETTNIGQFVVTDPSSFTPQNAITFQTMTFEISGAAPPYARVFFSEVGNCTVMSQGPLQASGSFGKTVSARIQLPQGAYTFCVEIPLDSGLYIPSGTLSVSQYNVRPLTAFAGRATMFLAQFQGQNVSSTVALSSSSGCVAPFLLASNPVAGKVNWTLNSGTYFTCVFNPASQSYILASQHLVHQSPTVDLSQAVRSLPIVIQTTAVSAILGDLDAPVVVFNISLGKATQIVPSGANSELNLWIPTSDYQYWYLFGQVPVRSFTLSHLPIFRGESFSLVVDDESWHGFQIRFAPNNSCTGGTEFSLPIPSSVTLTSSGFTTVCVNGSRFGFQAAAVDRVYDVPFVTPQHILENKTTAITIFNVPVGQIIVHGSNCGTPAGTLTSTGEQTQVSLAAAAGATMFCSTYTGTRDTLTSLRTLGIVSSFRVGVRPSIQVVNTLSTYFLSISDPSLLERQNLFVGLQCSQPFDPVPISQVNGVIFASLTPSLVGASLHVCVGNLTQPYVSVSRTRVTAPFDLSYGIALAGLPVVVSVMGTIFQPQQFVVSSSSQACENGTHVITGSLSSGIATIRLPVAQIYFVCAVADDGSTLLQAGAIVVQSFSSSSTTLVRLKENILTVTSLAAGASLFISPNTNCSGTQYATSPILSASAGQYTVCQLAGGYVSGSTNLVQVIDQFKAVVPTVVYSFVPFTANLSLGDLSRRSEVTLFLSLTNCSGNAEATYSSLSVYTAVITLPTLAFVRSVLCIRSADGYVTAQIAEFFPQPYMTPHTIASTVPVSILSGARRSGFAVIAPSAACGFDWVNPSAIGPNGLSTFVVPFSPSQVGYYCEGDTASQFQLRGVMSIIHLTNSFGEQQGIRNQTVLPGVPVIPDINSTMVSDPFFSSSPSCANQVDLSAGYLPSEGESVYFFVCVLSTDQTLRFTTKFPSVRILGFTIQPKAYSAGGGQQSFSLSSSIPGNTELTLSSTTMCTNNVSAVSILGSAGTVWPASSLDGIMYLCARRSDGVKAITSLLVALPPSETGRTLSIVQVPICFSLQSPSMVYSLDGDDSSFQSFQPYYSSANRTFFLAGSKSLCYSGIGVSDAKMLQNSSSVCISTSRVALNIGYQLCIGIPSGFVSIGSVTFATVSPSPSIVVSGGAVPLTLHNMPLSTFELSSSPACLSTDSKSYATNGTSVATSFEASSTNGSFLNPGLFFVCMKSPVATLVPVANLTVTPATFFGVSNSRIVQHVATTIELLYDFTADAIIGLRSSSACSVATGIASLSVASATSVVLTGSTPGVVYLCAITPVNNTIVVVASITIVSPFAQFSAQASTCTDLTIGLSPPGTFTTLALIGSDYCCSSQSLEVLVTATASSTTVRRALVTDTDLERFDGRISFALCAYNATTCYGLGQISFVSSSCGSTPAPQTPTPGSQTGNNGTSNNNRQDLATSTTQEQSKQITPTIVLAAVFILLLIVVVIIIVVQCCIRSRRVIPSDVEAGKSSDMHDDAAGNADDNEWKRTFDSIVSTNKRGATTAVTLNQLLHVPISMRLDTCREAPIPIQLLELQERDARAALSVVEMNTYLRLVSNIEHECMELREYCAAVEKTRVLQNVSTLLYAECLSLAELEEASRTEILDEEEERRLGVVDVEKTHWRHQVDLEGQRLKDTLERDPFWRNRRRLLREAHVRAMQSVQASPAAFDPTPNRTVMVDQTELESRYSKEQDLYY